MVYTLCSVFTIADECLKLIKTQWEKESSVFCNLLWSAYAIIHCLCWILSHNYKLPYEAFIRRVHMMKHLNQFIHKILWVNSSLWNTLSLLFMNYLRSIQSVKHLRSVHCVKHLKSVHIVNHSQSLHCKAPSVNSVCKTSLINLFMKHSQLFCIVKHSQSFHLMKNLW